MDSSYMDNDDVPNGGAVKNEDDIDEGEVSTDSSDSDIRRGGGYRNKPKKPRSASATSEIGVPVKREDDYAIKSESSKKSLKHSSDNDATIRSDTEMDDVPTQQPSPKKSPEEKVRSRPSSQNSNAPSVASKDSGDNDSKADLPYVTRGRGTGDTASNSGNTSGGEGSDPRSNGNREPVIDRPKEKGPTPPTASFLESLTEEERRTRTRFLPAVEGMRTLRKSEVKRDMALARSIATADGYISNIASMRKGKNKRSRSDEGEMEVDEDTGSSSPDDDVVSMALRSGMGVTIGPEGYAVPSTAFVPSSKPTHTISITSDPSANFPNKIEIMSPSIVEAISAFNPPRPPESIGTKKKHRMLRWERRPEDVQVDLGNYRKTVQRTHKELHSAEEERDRLHIIDAHLRRHFLNHLELLGGEYKRLNAEINEVQEECLKAADVVTSRTRSRGAGANSQVMQDLISALTAHRGPGQPNSAALAEPRPSGVCGLTAAAFADWDQSSVFKPALLANAWMTKGDRVQTPYGDGVVASVLFSKHPEISETPATNAPEMTTSELKAVRNGTIQGGLSFDSVLPPRICVRLPFGLGYFGVGSVKAIENPASFSDARLSARWMEMANNLSSSGSFLDIEGNDLVEQQLQRIKEEDDNMIISDPAMDEQQMHTDEPKTKKQRLIPYGSTLMPTSVGRGAYLSEVPIRDLEQGMRSALFSGSGELNHTTNFGVPSVVESWEDEKQEHYALEARILQLRNELSRQKRARHLNERTLESMRDRSSQVSEKQADIYNLKMRLKEELSEQGIDEATSAAILLSHYNRGRQ